MNRDELLKHCRYYNGEAKCPFDDGDMAWFWDMERVYVRNNGEGEYYLALGGRIYPKIQWNVRIYCASAQKTVYLQCLTFCVITKCKAI